MTPQKFDYSLLSTATVVGVTLVTLAGGGVLTVAIKSVAGLLTYHALRVVGDDLQKLREAEREAGMSGRKARLYALAIEVLAAAAGTAVFVLISPAAALIAIPLLAGGWLAYHAFRQAQQRTMGEAAE